MKSVIVAAAVVLLSTQAVPAQTSSTSGSAPSSSVTSGSGAPDSRVTGTAPSGPTTDTMRRYNNARQGTVGAAPAETEGDKAVQQEDRLIDSKIRNICKNC